MTAGVSGFSGFLSVPRAGVKYDATTHRDGFVERPHATGRKKPGKPRNPAAPDQGGPR